MVVQPGRPSELFASVSDLYCVSVEGSARAPADLYCVTAAVM